MHTYYIISDNTKVSRHGGGAGFTEYFNHKNTVMKAQSMDNVRARVVKEIFGGKPGRCDVYPVNREGLPNFGNLIGQIRFYGNIDEYYYEVKDSHNLIRFDPKTGKLMR